MPADGFDICGNEDSEYIRVSISKKSMHSYAYQTEDDIDDETKLFEHIISPIISFNGIGSINSMTFNPEKLASIGKKISQSAMSYNITLQWTVAQNWTKNIVPACAFFDNGMYDSNCPCTVLQQTPYSIVYNCTKLYDLCPVPIKSDDISIGKSRSGHSILGHNRKHPHYTLDRNRFHRNLDFEYQALHDDDLSGKSSSNVKEYGTLVRAMKTNLQDTLSSKITIGDVREALLPLGIMSAVFFICIFLVFYLHHWDNIDYTYIRYIKDQSNEMRSKLSSYVVNQIDDDEEEDGKKELVESVNKPSLIKSNNFIVNAFVPTMLNIDYDKSKLATTALDSSLHNLFDISGLPQVGFEELAGDKIARLTHMKHQLKSAWFVGEGSDCNSEYTKSITSEAQNCLKQLNAIAKQRQRIFDDEKDESKSDLCKSSLHSTTETKEKRRLSDNIDVASMTNKTKFNNYLHRTSNDQKKANIGSPCLVLREAIASKNTNDRNLEELVPPKKVSDLYPFRLCNQSDSVSSIDTSQSAISTIGDDTEFWLHYDPSDRIKRRANTEWNKEEYNKIMNEIEGRINYDLTDDKNETSLTSDGKVDEVNSLPSVGDNTVIVSYEKVLSRNNNAAKTSYVVDKVIDDASQVYLKNFIDFKDMEQADSIDSIVDDMNPNDDDISISFTDMMEKDDDDNNDSLGEKVRELEKEREVCLSKEVSLKITEDEKKEKFLQDEYTRAQGGVVFNEVLDPHSLLASDIPQYMRFYHAIIREHHWIRIFTYPSVRLPRLIRFLTVLTNLMFIFFVDSLFFGIYFNNDGSCEALSFTESVTCLKQQSDYQSSSSKCEWNETSQICSLRPPPSNFEFYIIVSILITIFTVIPYVFCESILREICALRPVFADSYNAANNTLERIKLKYAARPSKLHKFAQMMDKRGIGKLQARDELLDLYAYYDQATVEEETNFLLSCIHEMLSTEVQTSAYPWRSQDISSKEQLKTSRKTIMSKLHVHEDGTPYDLPLLHRLYYKSPRDKIEWKIKRARERMNSILIDLDYFVEGEEDCMDTLLIQSFILEQVDPIRRFALKREFFKFDTAAPGYVNGYVYLAAWAFMMFVWMYLVGWLFQWIITNRGLTANAWAKQLGFVLFQEIVLNELLGIYIMNVLVMDSIRPQLQVIYDVLNNILYTKICQQIDVTPGVIRLCQHLSGACRAARHPKVNSLPASQLLLRIDDSDIKRFHATHGLELGWILVVLVSIPTALNFLYDSVQDIMYAIFVPSVWWATIYSNIILYRYAPYILYIIYGAVGLCILNANRIRFSLACSKMVINIKNSLSRDHLQEDISISSVMDDLNGSIASNDSKKEKHETVIDISHQTSSSSDCYDNTDEVRGGIDFVKLGVLSTQKTIDLHNKLWLKCNNNINHLKYSPLRRCKLNEILDSNSSGPSNFDEDENNTREVIGINEKMRFSNSHIISSSFFESIEKEDAQRDAFVDTKICNRAFDQHVISTFYDYEEELDESDIWDKAELDNNGNTNLMLRALPLEVLDLASPRSPRKAKFLFRQKLHSLEAFVNKLFWGELKDERDMMVDKGMNVDKLTHHSPLNNCEQQSNAKRHNLKLVDIRPVIEVRQNSKRRQILLEYSKHEDEVSEVLSLASGDTEVEVEENI